MLFEDPNLDVIYSAINAMLAQSYKLVQSAENIVSFLLNVHYPESALRANNNNNCKVKMLSNAGLRFYSAIHVVSRIRAELICILFTNTSW